MELKNTDFKHHWLYAFLPTCARCLDQRTIRRPFQPQPNSGITKSSEGWNTNTMVEIYLGLSILRAQIVNNCSILIKNKKKKNTDAKCFFYSDLFIFSPHNALMYRGSHKYLWHQHPISQTSDMAEANGRTAFNPEVFVRGDPCSSTKTRHRQLHINWCMIFQITGYNSQDKNRFLQLA